jgi:hypothetical protein
MIVQLLAYLNANWYYVIHAVFLTQTIELLENSSIVVTLKEEFRFAHQK